jgi:hypothetical protein
MVGLIGFGLSMQVLGLALALHAHYRGRAR